MGKKKALRRLILQEILTSKARFISITLLILLGVSFFSGLNAAGPDMKKTAALFFENHNLMDIHVVSTMGLEEEDINILKSQADVALVEADYSQDVVTKQEEKLLKIYSYDEENTLNQFKVQEGRLPENNGEIALVNSNVMMQLYKIGDTVTFIPDSEDNDLSEQFKKTDYTVVGFVTSPMYVSEKQLGSSSIGKGSLDGYGVIEADDFNISVYTDVYMTFKSLEGIDPYSEQYKKTISEYQEKIEDSFQDRSVIRLEDVKAEAKEELEDAKGKVADGKQELEDGLTKLTDAKEKIEDGKVQIADAELELADAKKKLTDGQAEYDKNKASFDEQIEGAEVQFAAAESQITDGQHTVTENYEKVADGKKQIADGLKQIKDQEDTLAKQKSQLEEFLEQTKQVIAVPVEYITSEQQSGLILAGSSITLGENQTLGDLWTAYFRGEASGDSIVAALEGIIAQIDNGLKTIAESKTQLLEKQKELEDAQVQLNNGQEALAEGANKLELKMQEFEVSKADGEKQLTDAKKQIKDGFAEYESGITEIEEQKIKLAEAEADYDEGLTEYNDKVDDAREEIAEAEEKIADGEKELAELDKVTYYAFSREDNPGYTEYADNAKRLSSLAMVFPAFFFAIASLVSLTTITRMIEEQRVQIGTLKAQGYTDREISLKYYVYAFCTSILGTILGLLLGFYGIPMVIIQAYSSMYNFPNTQLAPYLSFGLISFGIAVFCTGITAWVVLRQELKCTPSVLMRPKAPKVGKRIWLERITPVWNQMNFNQKVTVRNLFRYKQRMFMTVFGIAGCMGLMMTGFGLNDSIADLSTLQYQSLLQYQAMVIYDEDAMQEDLNEAQTAISNVKGLNDSLLVKVEQYDVKRTGVNTQQVLIMVPKETKRFSNFVLIRERGSKDSYDMPAEGAVITEKLSDLFGVKPGDTITLTNADNEEFDVPVAKITENYAGHYMYLSPETYEKYVDSSITYNGELLSYKQNEEWEDDVMSSMDQYNAIQAISFNSSTVEMFDDSMGSLTTVVVVIIIAAAVLAFVVLYNLTNINVSERIRELSTIKVLGFYDKEVTMYIYRENVILSLLGIFFGSILGKLLHYFVLNTASMDNMMFSYLLHVKSYIFAGILTLLFSSMVMWVMHNKLKHVDMIEALKSNE